MEGKMSNKFLKILGICVLIVLLPVLITVTAVCLVEDTNENSDANVPTYVVKCGDYAEDVKIKENKEGKWVFVSMPVRTGYELSSIKVDGKTYAIKDGEVVLTEKTEEAFETAVTGEKEIKAEAWTCDYNSIWVGVAGTLDDYCVDSENGYFEMTNTILENINIFTCLGYQKFATYPITSLNVRIDSDGDGDVDDSDNATYKITFSKADKTEGGDITLSTLIAKLEGEGATINVDADKYTEFELSIA